MSASEKDLQILKHILEHCNGVLASIDRLNLEMVLLDNFLFTFLCDSLSSSDTLSLEWSE